MTARVLSAASCRFESASVDLSSHNENPASVFDGVPSEFAYPFDRWDADAGLEKLVGIAPRRSAPQAVKP
jgi:hypothetical protein